jgi:hypothetical protein
MADDVTRRYPSCAGCSCTDSLSSVHLFLPEAVRGCGNRQHNIFAMAFSFSPCNCCECLIGCRERDMAIWEVKTLT